MQHISQRVHGQSKAARPGSPRSVRGSSADGILHHSVRTLSRNRRVVLVNVRQVLMTATRGSMDRGGKTPYCWGMQGDAWWLVGVRGCGPGCVHLVPRAQHRTQSAFEGDGSIMTEHTCRPARCEWLCCFLGPSTPDVLPPPELLPPEDLPFPPAIVDMHVDARGERVLTITFFPTR